MSFPPYSNLSGGRCLTYIGTEGARLVSIACSDAPEGYARWTLHRLADRLVELNVVDSISHECVRQILKKHHQTLAEANVVYPGRG